MKRIIAAAVIMSLILCGCRVGPREGADILSSGDISEPITSVADTQTEPAAESEIDEILPSAEPETTSAPDEAPIETEAPPVTSVQTEATEETSLVFNSEDYEIEYYETAKILYSTISLNVRSGPSVDYGSIGALYEGQKVNAVGYVGRTGWYLIEYRDDYGFVSGYYMADEDPNPPEEQTKTPEEEFGQPDPLDHAAQSTIISDFAALIGVDADSVVLAKYYGSFDAGEVVLLYSTELGYTCDMKYLSVGGYDFELASGGYSIDLHTSDGRFIDISEAYENGLLSERDIAAIHYYGENF